jgi:antitoxin PrlF
MLKSRLTAKARTTIPQPVRAALSLRVGDELIYTIDGDRAVLTKAVRSAPDDPYCVFHEWSSQADRKAYAKL